jgi:dTDP-glucose 4,6-dehydratase
MVPRFVTSALKNEPLTIHGDGQAKRDWIYVLDTCEAIDRALHLEDFSKIKNQVLNVGTGRAVSVLDIAKLILKETGKSESLIGYIGDRPGQVKCHLSSTDKAKALLGWQAKISLAGGLKQTIDWYKNNEAWWRDLEWMKHVPIRTTDGKIEMH